ncbi:nitroreductase family protein [Hydrogenimonas sp.]
MPHSAARAYHEATAHTWLSVRRNPNRLDWEHQPSSMKSYPPSFSRTPLQKEIPAHSLLYHIGGITAKKSYPGVTYLLRTNPSAGALYPTELYFQARGVEGFGDGIYHFEVGSSSAVLLHPIGADEGLEPLLKLPRPMRGLLFFITSPWYRSAWKYKKRAFRYCLLDGGHLLGGIEAAAPLYRHACRIAYRIDIERGNRFFGFDEKEFLLAAAIAAVPLRDAHPVTLPPNPLPPCDPVGRYEPDETILKAYKACTALLGCRTQPAHPAFTLHEKAWEEAILTRRSARAFAPVSISRGAYEAIMEHLALPVPSDCDEPLRIYSVIHRVEGMKPGLYRDGECLKEGDFRQKTAYLCLEQRLGGDGAFTLFILSDGRNYRPLYLKAGIFGHRTYLLSRYLGLGCSGIGAYYDDEVRAFLQDDGMVLYALSVGHPAPNG